MELNKKYLLIIIGTIILIGYFFVIDDASPSFSAMIPNSVEVEKNTELTYYLNVSFDGVDINGNSSSDTSISDLNSEVIYIEDKIPVGLTFQGFVTTSNGTIGAFKKSDGTSCVGKVIDDTPNSKCI